MDTSNRFHRSVPTVIGYVFEKSDFLSILIGSVFEKFDFSSIAHRFESISVDYTAPSGVGGLGGFILPRIKNSWLFAPKIMQVFNYFSLHKVFF